MMRLFIIVLILAGLSFSGSVSALNYGEGLYGTCQYGSCSISVASSGSLLLDLPFTGGATSSCSVDKDTVTVNTLSSTGYSLYVSSSSSDTDLNGVAYDGVIVASSATAGSPSALAYGTWGYRIDGGAFGVGPTSPQTGGAIPSVTFAGIPALASPAYIAGSSSAANPAVTDVWLGLCVDIATTADDYINSVVYSAIVN